VSLNKLLNIVGWGAVVFALIVLLNGDLAYRGKSYSGMEYDEWLAFSLVVVAGLSLTSAGRTYLEAKSALPASLLRVISLILLIVGIYAMRLPYFPY
jgi:hypothetical protein